MCPLGAFLSGGIDSSTIVALMQAQSDRPVRTFTIGFDQEQFDEAAYAKEVAQHIGTEHTEFYVSTDDALDVIPRLPDLYDEPFADSSQLPRYLVSAMTRQHVTVALSGDGGDELFAGYTRYRWADLLRRRTQYVPCALRAMAGDLIGYIPARFWEAGNRLLPPDRRIQRISERAFKLSQFLKQDSADGIYRRQHTH